MASPVSGAVGQGVDQTPVGAIGHLGIAPEMLHRLAHRAPARVFLAVPVDHAQNLELPGIVDGRLDPEDILVIVELDRVGLEAEPDPTAFGPRLAVDRDLTGEGRVRLALEEAQDVGGPEPGHRGRDQIVAHRLEHAALLEQQVGGVLALVDHPPVRAEPGLLKIRQQRVDHPGQPIEEGRPGGVGEAVAKLAGRLDIGHPGDLVVARR